MPSMDSYYPRSNEGRADWWQNILDNGPAAFASLNLSVGASAAILNDARWGIYLYRTLRMAYDDAFGAIVAYADQITGGPENTPLPMAPDPVPWPTLPTPAVLCGLEARRERWVAELKTEALYTPAIGTLLRVVSTAPSFNPATYQAELFGLSCPAGHAVGGKFRKANGNVDGINLSGRREGTAGWTMLGRFNASPFTANVPLAGAAPEAWEFQARAVKRDVEIGVPSAIIPLLIRG